MVARNLVFVCDGTLSSIREGEETNAGLFYRLLTRADADPRQTVLYDPGVQGTGWRKWLNAASGRGVNRSIKNGYAFLARHWRPGDRIYLLGYSRGAYAVRSLAGMIGGVGLLRPEYARARYVDLAFRYYEVGSKSPARRHFSHHRCHEHVPIQMLGVWDTVKSLGLPYPLLNRLAPMATEFHDHRLGDHIHHGFHALAIDENRTSYAPDSLGTEPRTGTGRLEQAWFPGGHPDIGGDVRGHPRRSRPLGNIALNWMLRRAATSWGLLLPQGMANRILPENPWRPRWSGPMRGIAQALSSFAHRRSSIGARPMARSMHLSRSVTGWRLKPRYQAARSA